MGPVTWKAILYHDVIMCHRSHVCQCLKASNRPFIHTGPTKRLNVRPCWRSVWYNNLKALWNEMAICQRKAMLTDREPMPLTKLWSNSKFEENCHYYSLTKTDLIKTKCYCLGMYHISMWSDWRGRKYELKYFDTIWKYIIFLVGRALLHSLSGSTYYVQGSILLIFFSSKFKIDRNFVLP